MSSESGTCGCAECALARSRGKAGKHTHESPKTTSGAAGPTKSKFAALRRKMSQLMNLPDHSKAPAAPTIGLGATAFTKAPIPAVGNGRTAPKPTTGLASDTIKESVDYRGMMAARRQYGVGPTEIAAMKGPRATSIQPANPTGHGAGGGWQRGPEQEFDPSHFAQHDTAQAAQPVQGLRAPVQPQMRGQEFTPEQLSRPPLPLMRR